MSRTKRENPGAPSWVGRRQNVLRHEFRTEWTQRDTEEAVLEAEADAQYDAAMAGYDEWPQIEVTAEAMEKLLAALETPPAPTEHLRDAMQNVHPGAQDITPSSGCVWLDLGFSEDVARELRRCAREAVAEKLPSK